MGICFSSALETQSPTTTEQLSSVATSRTASNTTCSTGSSNVSGNSQFSAASGWDEASPSGQILPLPNLRMFTFSELKTATRNFRSDTVLGEGGFGKVYKGWLDEKGTTKGGSATVIAVKKLNAESSQGFQEWQSEVNFLGRLSHPNLVKLLGYCWEDKELLLIYEFMQKGSLENHLFGRGSAVLPLPWDTRLKILIGAARGLAFLHASDRKVIYRDFKASNILLDGSYNAKISDFGLAKMGPTPSKSHVTTRVMGTNGYAAPEYIATGHLYVKSDVYGFGVVLVEMLTGLRVLDENRPDGKHNLVEWVKPLLFDKRKLKNIMDSRLEGKYPSRSAIQTAQLALSCIESEPKNRPSMREIVEILERIDSVHEKHKDVIVNSWDRASSRTQKPLKYRSPVHPRHDHSPIHPMRDLSPIHPMRDRSPVHPRHDHSPIHPVHDNSPIHPMRDRSPIHPVHDHSPIHPMLDRSPIHPMRNHSPVHPRHDRSPVHPRHNHSPIHPRHDRSPVHPVHDNSPIHPMCDRSPIHPRHDHSPIHPRHHRSPIHPRHDVNQAYPLPPRT